MAKRILIVSHHFYPDAEVGAKRMSELARYLCSEAYEVLVVAARPSRGGEVDPALRLDSPNLRHIWIPQPPKLLPFLLPRIKLLLARGGGDKQAVVSRSVVPAESGKESLLHRLRRAYLSLEWLIDDKKLWAALVAVRLLGFAFTKPFDAVISSGPPMSTHLAVLLARPVLRGRWIIDLRDPWCDQDQRSYVQTKLSRQLDRWFEARAVAVADAVTVTTPSYKQLLCQRYSEKRERIQLVLNGFDGEVEARPPPSGKLHLLYAGSLYYNRDPFPLLRGIRELVNRPDVDRSRVIVRLVGDCQSWNGASVAGWIQDNGLQDCVVIHPRVPAAEVGALLAEANVLINFAQAQPMQIPAKMFDYLAARREVLLITEPHSDTAWLARQAGCARIVPPGDDAAMNSTLASLYHDYVEAPQNLKLSSTPSLTAFSRRAQSEKFVDLLQGGSIVEQEAEL
jgi:glycosyltransferase involved in cell wall biosynthesis